MLEKDDSKEQSKVDKLFERCKAGTINTQLFKQLTGRNVTIGGKADYSKFSGRALREIRANQAREAIKGQTHYLDGTLIDESRVIELRP